MKFGFFPKLAFSNVRKNYRFFIPRILAEAGLLACFYISITLMLDKRLQDVKGGSYLPTFMTIGVTVLAILSVIIMLYTNSFLMKQRKKEFGIYNVLGMEKKHVTRVLFHESLISGASSIILGIGLGILFYKLCSLLICKLLQSKVIIGFYFIKPSTIIPAALAFVGIDVLTFIINCISIARLKPVELLSSKAQGEKEPKVKWVLFALGLISLGAGYYIALTTKNPLDALSLFFIAILLVVIGTYFLFVAGSIFFLKLLKKNKKYYYNKNHMPAVSGLLYRMKQNAVGLASIAILATGVLVMISTTVSLYSGLDGTLKSHYPQDLYVSATYKTTEGKYGYVPADVLESTVQKVAAENNLKIKETRQNDYLYVSFLLENGVLKMDVADGKPISDLKNLADFLFITEKNYTELTGETLGLCGNDVCVARISTTVDEMNTVLDSITLGDTKYNVKKTLPYYPIENPMTINAFQTYGVVVADDTVLQKIYDTQKEGYGDYASEFTSQLSVTFESIQKAAENSEKIHLELMAEFYAYIEKMPDFNEDGLYTAYTIDSVWEAREALIGMYGTLLFLGILLGAVCIFATVLIIYYKQISEGYEDRARFQIMQKIGMSHKEVNKTIKKQILLVFFLPLVTAGVHLIFAYPLLTKLLSILMLYKKSLFMTCAIITYAIFAVIYVIIYLRTSRTYYKIVR